jgi:8-oxo-dGTP pyrophosphatase MutT (NUDIX family)
MSLVVGHEEQGTTSDLSMHAVAFVFDDAGRVLLVQENYGARRYGPPGGGVDPGESPQAAAVREALEEAGIVVSVSHLVGIRWTELDGARFLGFGFRCEIVDGTPTPPPTGEIASLGWYDPHDPPQPTTNLARLLLVPALRGERGLVFSTGD